VSQLCDKDNLIVFSPTHCLVVNMNTGDVVLRGKRHKNIYQICISSIPQNNLTCLSALNDDVMLWHNRIFLDLVELTFLKNFPYFCCSCVI